MLDVGARCVSLIRNMIFLDRQTVSIITRMSWAERVVTTYYNSQALYTCKTQVIDRAKYQLKASLVSKYLNLNFKELNMREPLVAS